MKIHSFNSIRHDTRVSVVASPEYGTAMLSYDGAGITVNVHLNAEDLRTLYLNIERALELFDARRLEEAA